MPVALGQYEGGEGRTKTSPLQVPRTRRVHEHRVLTSGQPGLALPLLAFPLLREDAVSGSFRVSSEMMETVEILVNAVKLRVLAYLVPFSAFDRFDGMDHLNRSYQKVAYPDGGTVTNFFSTKTFAKASDDILTTMGFHAREGQTINTAYIEAYNEIFNLRCRNRSPDLIPRAPGLATLAPAFWDHQMWANTVPDFDQAAVEGEVPLTIASGNLPVKGIANTSTVQTTTTNSTVRESGSTVSVQRTGWNVSASAPAAGQTNLWVTAKAGTPAGFPDIYAELAENGITVSLANIEMARKTQAFALLRKQYNGLEDDYIMDLLMSGITVPDQELRKPILLADESTVFGMNKRYSTTADDLTASVVNGGTFVDISIRTPAIHPGGIVMLIAEVTPEQLFERQADPMLFTTDQATLPEYIRDTLDPEKVDVVTCEQVDIQHSTPSTTFGYTFMNAKWARSMAKVGGKFYRPTPDGAFDEDRQRLWAVETANPLLSRDFYLCGTVHRKPFVDTVSHAFEFVVRGNTSIEGNTVFGRPLVEASDDYDQIMDQAPDVPMVPKAAEVEEAV